MRVIFTVFKKEMVDHLRDGRSILVSTIYPLMGPLLLVMMFFFVGGSMRLTDTGPLLVLTLALLLVSAGWLDREGSG